MGARGCRLIFATLLVISSISQTNRRFLEIMSWFERLSIGTDDHVARIKMV